MEFGSLGLGTQNQATNTQTGGANTAQTATLETNPENVVTPSARNSAAKNELRRDSAGQGAVVADDEQTKSPNEPLTNRRTTLNFDSEQNRIFLEVVDTTTEEVVERIPSEKFVALVEQSVSPPRDIALQGTSESDDGNASG